MTGPGHERFGDDAGAYLLGALGDDERRAFEAHMEGCPDCRAEVERLRPAAEALPRSVEQLRPPESLARSLMEVVEGEAAAAEPAQPRRARPRRRVRDLLLSPRVLRPVAVAATLAVGVVTGLAVSQLGGGDEERTISAQVDERALPLASATLRVADDGEGAVLTAEGLPELRAGRVYQAWVQRGERIEPQPTFVAGMDGRGAVALPEDLSGATAVLVTREPRGGATRPGEAPIMRVSL